MASIINASNSGFGGIVSTGDSSGQLQLQTAATTAVTIDASQNATFANNVYLGGANLSAYTFKNYLINGNFDFWQRGTTGTYTTGANVVTDRWQYITDGTLSSGTVISQQTFTLGQTSVPNNPTYYMQVAYTSVNTPSNYIRQRIENVATLSGQTVTFSFWARVTSGTLSTSAQFQQEFGSGGSPSAGVYGIGSTSYTFTTTWQKFTLTTTLPSVSGKTLGTNGDSALNAAIIFPASGSATVQISQAQVEAGPNATQFEYRPLQMELALCQRYYEKSYDVNVTPGTTTGSGLNYQIGTSDGSSNAGITLYFKVTKRSITGSTFTAYQQGGTSGSWNYGRSGASGTSAVTTSFLGTNGGLIYFGVGAAYVGCSVYGHWTISCEL